MTMRKMSEIVRDQRPVTMPPEATVMEACRKMRDRRVGAVLVTDENKRLLGIFTGRDAVCKMLAEGKDARNIPLSQVMTREPRTMPLTKIAIDALRLMRDGGFRHVPVVADGKVVGVVSHGDFRGLETARLDDETDFWERL
jgi:CBS domain-containing protein